MRKIFMAVLGAVIAFFGLFGVHVNVEVDPTSVIVSLLFIGVWLLREFKTDWAELMKGIQQTNKLSDPAFWVTAITSVALPVLSLFGVVMTEALITTIASLCALVVPLVLGIFRKTTAD